MTQIEAFCSSEYAEIDKILKSEFVDYMFKLRELSADIMTHECDISSDEDDLKKLTSLSFKDSKLQQTLSNIKQDFCKQSDIYKKKDTLEEMYARKRQMLDNIKSLLDTEGSHSLVCPVCFEKNVSCFIKTCGHTFCLKCINMLKYQKCPMCRVDFDTYEIKNLIYS